MNPLAIWILEKFSLDLDEGLSSCDEEHVNPFGLYHNCESAGRMVAVRRSDASQLCSSIAFFPSAPWAFSPLINLPYLPYFRNNCL